ncbi:MAG TPA: OFA family MFS transporter [Gemmatimonadales bacterium]|nr:OFA family MFS transporter [Gemmatimonadales bacterium]
MAGSLAKERLTAGPGFNRWLIPPAALAIHLSIGQAYAFSVFNLPLSKVLGVTAPASGDWKLTDLGWVFTLAIVFLGLSAAVFGRWLEDAGPRKSGLAAAAGWGTGFLVGALGARTHQLWLLLLGYGVIGGCGLGLGYITPVSTLIKWFPDRRGMATGLAIMGFGGGAMIAAPLSTALMHRFAGPGTVGVAETFVVLGLIYFVAMALGALAFRLPAAGWRPAGYVAPSVPRPLISRHDVHPRDAIRTPQFWLLWAVLCLNVTAGIGVLGQASPMIQEVFHGRIDAAAAAGFVGLLSLFNMSGRFFWSSLSDRIGRKATYATFFTLGALLYAAVPFAGRIGSIALFVACFAVILTMYGGGFATIPAYLSDLFGIRYVGAIHGRLLTAWSAAGVFGPVLVNYIRQYEIDRGVPTAQAYNYTLYLMAGLLLVGLICNFAVTPVGSRHYLAEGDVLPEPERPAGDRSTVAGSLSPTAGAGAVLAVAWTAVGAPLAWGITSTIQRALALFRH